MAARRLTRGRWARLTLGLSAGVAAIAILAERGAVAQGARNAPHLEPAFAAQTRAPEARSGVALAAAPFGGPLDNAWGIAALPGGGYLVTERPGRLRAVSPSGELSAPIAGLPPVLAEGQGGLLDVATGPDFATDRRIWWTYAKPLGAGLSATAAARGVLAADLSEVAGAEDIFVQEPPSPTPIQYGSRIVFDTAGRAFITTGEHASMRERALAQDLATTYGKVIRLWPDGTVPEDNPFVGREGLDAIWSYGHRNPQGAAIEPGTGRLWTVEHGPRGGDELNTPGPGVNYGWPVVSYGVNYDGSAVGEGLARKPGMEEPRYFWDPVIAPSGMVFYDGAMFPEWQGDLLIGSLNPGGLVRLEIDGDRVTGEERLLAGIGRVRDIELAPDGALILAIDAPGTPLMRVARAGN